VLINIVKYSIIRESFLGFRRKRDWSERKRLQGYTEGEKPGRVILNFLRAIFMGLESKEDK
jgi:hypothetical protein